MDLPLLISLSLNTLGTLVTIGGSIYMAMGYKRLAHILLITGSTLLMILFFGIYMGYWIINTGALVQAVAQIVYIAINSYGYGQPLKGE